MVDIMYEQKKYIIENVDRLEKNDLIQFINMHIVANELKSMLKETADGVTFDLDIIKDPEIIKSMYLHIDQLCMKLDQE